MSVVKGKRKESKFEAQHHYYKLRQEVTTLMLLDFGFSKEKYNKMIERYAETHKDNTNVDEIVERYRKKCQSFYDWFVDKECDALLDILRICLGMGLMRKLCQIGREKILINCIQNYSGGMRNEYNDNYSL